MNILAIETSCDETAIAVLRSGGTATRPVIKVLSNEVSSQIPVHRPYGGVVPMLAKREHTKNLPVVLEKALKKANFLNHDSRFIIHDPESGDVGARITNLQQIKLQKKIDLIAVTVGPGLEPALWTGIEFAKQLKKSWKVPVIGTNHMEGHMYSFLLNDKRERLNFPVIALVVSGGHTILAVMESLIKWKRIGETVDDAAGEAFDKVARMMNLPYPGGALIEKLGAEGSAGAIDFPRPMLQAKNYNFSFSGLKTAVLYYMKDHPGASKEDICASFQAAVCDTLAIKAVRAAKEYGSKAVILSGGVASNKCLQNTLREHLKQIKGKLVTSQHHFNTDNASMIGVAGYMAHLQKKKRPLKANAHINL